MSSSKIVIIDYGSGNIKSVLNAISLIKGPNQEVLISNDPNQLKTATHIILPGVGAFKDCMNGLEEVSGLIEEIKAQIRNKKPFLGICVGMQLLADIGFEDGENKGLSLIPGEVKKMNNDQGKIKIPHVGWNNLEIIKENKILNDVKNQDHVYFVHSYFFDVKDQENVIAVTNYGSNKINALLAKDNIFAAQFHPEKSAEAGLKILKNFINL